MSLRIRLARGGAKKRPFFRIVVADSRMPRDGRFIERLGSYNPMLPKDHPDRVMLKEDRVRHWLGVGAQPSDRVSRFLGAAGLAGQRDVPIQTKKNLPSEKTQARQQEREATLKAKAKAEAEARAAAPAEPEASAQESPAEETSADNAVAEEALVEEEKAEG